MSDAPDNLSLWKSVERTDPAHVKPITGKSYGGSSPKPHWLVLRATEAFGPCGIGWGFTVVDERIENGSDGDRMSFARVRVWYKWNGERGEVEHVGGTPFSGKRKNGTPYADEDAPKKSVTDALTKALSMIGFAGDIFLGRWDDSKYQAELREEFSAPSPKSEAARLYYDESVRRIDKESNARVIKNWWQSDGAKKEREDILDKDTHLKLLAHAKKRIAELERAAA